MGVDKKKYDRVARFYDIFELPMEVVAFSRWRSELLKRVEGKRVLEVGIGTGKNIPYYGAWDCAGLDISRRMLERAFKRSEILKKQIHMIQGDVESLPFKDGVFDGVISTYVFCSVENPEKGLMEIYRVLKDGGRAYFLEHVRSESETVGKIMDLLNPIFRAFGPEINRRTVEKIEKAGFRIVEDARLMSSVFRMIVAEKRSA